MSLLMHLDIDHRDVPITNAWPRQTVIFRHRVVQRGPTEDDPTLEVAYVVRRFETTAWDFYRNRPEVLHE